jgi:hypothetical protein
LYAVTSLLKRKFSNGDSNRKLAPISKQNEGSFDNFINEVLNKYKKLKSPLAESILSAKDTPAPIESKKVLAPKVDSRSKMSPKPTTIELVLTDVTFLRIKRIAADQGNLM